MTYREPADVPSTSCIDTAALAFEVTRQEADAWQKESAHKLRREQAEAKTRAEADLRPTRVSATSDHSGALLRIAHLSGSKVPLWIAVISSVVGSVVVGAGLLALPGFIKLAVLPVAMATGLAAWSFFVQRMAQRPVHIYGANNGFFVLYRDRADKSVMMGRLEHFEFDVRGDSSSGLKTMMPKYNGQSGLHEHCDRLTPSDMETLEAFAERFGIRVF